MRTLDHLGSDRADARLPLSVPAVKTAYQPVIFSVADHADRRKSASVL